MIAPAERPSRTVLLPGLALMAVACLALAGLALFQVRSIAPELDRIQVGIGRSFEVIKAARSLERAMTGAERSVRNYLITGDTAQLDESRARAREALPMPWKLRRLAPLAQGERIAALEHEVASALAALQRLADTYAREGPLVARNELRRHLGDDTMSRIAATLDLVVAAEDQRLGMLQARAAEHERTFAGVAIGTGVLAVIVMLLGAYELAQAFRNLRRAGEERRVSEAQFRRFVAGVTDYAVYTMDPEGRVTSWNAGAERIKGYAAKEILGRSFARFYTEADQKAGVPQLALETAKREGRYESEARRVRKDGSLLWAHVVLDPIRDESGRLLGFVKVTRDVSERRAQQEALDHARAALAQAQKMEALGQLTGGVAHDFNNLLTVIMGALEALERRLRAGNFDVAKLVETARRGADRAADLVSRLLAFARRQPLEPQPLDPNRLVSGVAGLARRSLAESIALETVLGGGTWWVAADRGQLENAVLNLVLNARDAMPGGGKLTIETGNVFLDENYARANPEVAQGEYALIAVTDTGTGMTAEQIAHAFEPFYTTKDVGQGSGLGLSQVYGFVRQSRGHVKIYSEPGRGTTVKLYLPRLEGPVPAEAPAEPPVEPRPSGEERILLVEDDEDVRQFAVATLKEAGYRVLEASDARSALRVLQEHEAIDLVLTDLGLPGGVNGRELAETAHRRKPELKILFMSGYARNAIVHRGVLDTGVNFLAKPFTQTSLARKVREVLDRAG